MRLSLLFATSVAVLSIGTLAASAGTVAVTPTLTFVSVSPLQVHGSHFRGRERVRVTFQGASTAPTVTVRTTLYGSFTLSAPSGFTTDGCGPAFVISAAGVHGDTALLRRPARLCAPAQPAPSPALPAPEPLPVPA